MQKNIEESSYATNRNKNGKNNDYDPIIPKKSAPSNLCLI